MGTFAIVTVAGGGNLPPTLGTAAELARRGHVVHVIADASLRERVSSAGHGFIALDALRGWNPAERRSVPRSIAVYVGLASDERLEREVAERLRELGADASMVDCLMAGSGRASRRAGVPEAVLFHTLHAFWRRGYVRGPVGVISGLRGVDPRRQWAAASARIVTSDPLLDPDALRPGASASIDWVGAPEHGRPAEPDPARPPLVVVSLSTTWLPGQTEVYQRIATALGALPVRGLITLGGLAPDRPLEVPANVEVVDLADHGAVLREAALLIGHGGHSTTFRALAHDVPVLAIPMHPLLDQPMVASAIAEAGAGIRLPKAASVDRIAAAVTALLADPRARAAAAEIGARVRAGDAAARAADVLERVSGVVIPAG